jgi:hypothetical protein
MIRWLGSEAARTGEGVRGGTSFVPVAAKPIFRPDVIRLPLLGFRLREHVVQLRPKLERWAKVIATGSVDAHKEQEILGDFTNDLTSSPSQMMDCALF